MQNIDHFLPVVKQSRQVTKCIVEAQLYDGTGRNGACQLPLQLDTE